jgi:hypothetical protein
MPGNEQGRRQATVHLSLIEGGIAKRTAKANTGIEHVFDARMFVRY